MENLQALVDRYKELRKYQYIDILNSSVILDGHFDVVELIEIANIVKVVQNDKTTREEFFRLYYL